MAPNNFPEVLPPAESDQTREILQDPYALEFLALEPRHSEQDLEDALVARLTRFLSELGTGFAFVGRQYKITVGARDYFIDCSDSRIIPRPKCRVTFDLRSQCIRLAVLGDRILSSPRLTSPTPRSTRSCAPCTSMTSRFAAAARSARA